MTRAVTTPRDDTTRSIGLDTVQYLTPHAVAAWSHGCRSALRYIRRDPVVRDDPDDSGDWLISLSHRELAELTEMGWDVGMVQIGSRSAPPTATVGRQVGEAAGHNARELVRVAGLPQGEMVSVWCDCEWSHTPSSAEAAAYLEAWSAGCVRASDGAAIPCLYVTPDLGALGATGIYRLPYRGYWYSATWHSGVAVRGPQIVQTGPHAITPTMCWPVPPGYNGAPGELVCDLDRLGWDHQGDRPRLLSLSALTPR